MEKEKYIILGGLEWPISKLREIEEGQDYIRIGGYLGTKFPIKAIMQYDKVFSPFSYTLGTLYTTGIKHNSLYDECSNPYALADKVTYKVSIVEKDKRYGLIDSDGNVLLSPVFNVIQVANQSRMPYFIVKKDNFAFMYDALKLRITSEFYDDIKYVTQHSPSSSSTDAYFKAYKNGKCGLLHETGKLILPPNFDDCFGLCWDGVSYNNPEYRFAIVTLDKKKGLFNELGKEVLPIEYDSMRFSHSDSIDATNIRVIGKKGDGKEEDLIEYGVKTFFAGQVGKGGDRKNVTHRKGNREKNTYERYGGSYAQDEMGYSDDEIDTIFDGDPDAYWNID